MKTGLQSIGLIGLTLLISRPGFRDAVQAGETSPGPWSEQAEAAWWKENSTPARWIGSVEELTDVLKEAHDRYGLDQMVRNPHWSAWMLHTRWLSLFPKDWSDTPVFQSDEGRKIFENLGRSHSLRNSFLGALVPQDNPPEAITILTRIAESHPEHILKYQNLAIAFAVVFDQPFPKSWPHAFVEPSKLPRGDLDPVDRFGFYVEANQKETLVHDLAKLEIHDLIFLVDSTLEFLEFRYARQIRIGTPGHLAQLYPQIPYTRDRITRKQHLWPHSTYRLIDIGKKGGICMDQAFFVAQTGKAHGIPTVLFTGQGLSGDHGWIGFLGSRRKWEMNLARVRDEAYPSGQAYHPQTWERITDSELTALQDRNEAPEFGRGQILLQWAALNKGSPTYFKTVRAARRSLSSDPRPWQMEADLIDETDQDSSERIRFWEDWVENFSDNPDLEVAGQLRLIALLEESGELERAERMRRKVMSANRSKRFDLGIAIAAEPVFRQLRKRDFQGASEEFSTAMRRFRSRAGGHLFYNLVQPYAIECLQEGQTERAKDTLRYLDDDFNARPGTMLDIDIQALRDAIERN